MLTLRRRRIAGEIGVFADGALRPLADAGNRRLAHHSDIAARYPIVWREPLGPTYAGSLTLGPDSMTMDGVTNGDRSVIEIAYDDLTQLRMATAGAERLGGRPTLVLHDRSGRGFSLAAVGGAGVMGEVADVLARALTVA